MSLALLAGALCARIHMLGISGPSGVALVNFCETLPSMVKLLNDLLRGFARPPGNAPLSTARGHAFHEPAVCWALGRSGSADSISPDGTQQKSVWARVSNNIHRMRRVEAKKMRSGRAPTSHLPDVMVVDLAVRSIITMLYLHACSPLLQHLFFF